LNIGIICYASAGGSGIVATELAKALAMRSHEVSVFSTEPPFRLGQYQAGVTFHRVETPGYPLFREPQYLLALANKIVQVARERRLDIVHAHYAIPHAAAAYLARQILSATDDGAPKIITTLHGTDITLLGSDPSYMETVAFTNSACGRASRSSASRSSWCRCCRRPTCSSCPRCRRASVWLRSRRWRARCPSWRRASGACRK
jgi:N-acetyl-alpha-D-glucosaminyl L-malate synthase BshA